jgi:protein tyrosine phosphatase
MDPTYQHANEIIDRVWLGDYHASQDETFLRSHHIDVVINCTKDLPFKMVAPTQYRVPLDDNLEEVEIRNAALWSYEIVHTIMKHYRAGDRILVHCMAGRQRSACSVAMFLILHKGLTTDQAIKMIRSKRPVAFMPQPNFLQSIQSFEERYQKEILPTLTGLHA